MFADRYGYDSASTQRCAVGVCKEKGGLPDQFYWRNLKVVHSGSISLRYVELTNVDVGVTIIYMYFKDRADAGARLAEEIVRHYRYEDCAVMALNDGAVLVAEPIAVALHSVLTMLLIENIEIPGENLMIGGLSQSGAFTYNGMLSAGQIEGYRQEFFGYFEEKKREAMGRINRLLGDGGLVDKDLLRGRNIILVSDGFDDAASLDVALDFLKPIRIQKLIVATPTASVPAVDRLHLFADELHVLDVKANFMGTNHYYDDNTIPSHEDTVKKINDIILNWQ